MAWRWTARRLAISAFVLFHLSALIIWTMPACAIKDRFQAPYRYYILPLGIWQWWAIFAPEPVRENQVLEAEVIDAKRLIRTSTSSPRSAICRGGRRSAGIAIPSSPSNMMID